MLPLRKWHIYDHTGICIMYSWLLRQLKRLTWHKLCCMDIWPSNGLYWMVFRNTDISSNGVCIFGIGIYQLLIACNWLLQVFIQWWLAFGRMWKTWCADEPLKFLVMYSFISKIRDPLLMEVLCVHVYVCMHVKDPLPFFVRVRALCPFSRLLSAPI